MFGHKSNERTLSTCWQAGQTVVQSGLGTPRVAGQFIATVRTIWVAVALFGFFDAFVCGIQTGKIPRYTVLCLKKITNETQLRDVQKTWNSVTELLKSNKNLAYGIL